MHSYVYELAITYVSLVPICCHPTDTWRKNNVIITSKRRRDVVWRHNVVIIGSCARWADWYLNKYGIISINTPQTNI